MKTIKLLGITILGIVIIGITSCQKQPVASFTTDKASYTGGEKVVLTNTSIDADSYKWTFPDGTTGSVANYDYILNAETEGSLTFKLEAFSKNGKKSDEESKTVTVVAAKGKATFWNQYAGTYRIQVTIGSQSEIISSDNTTSPGCDAVNCANFELQPDSYSYSAIDLDWTPAVTWTGTIDITAGGCTTLQLLDPSKKK